MSRSLLRCLLSITLLAPGMPAIGGESRTVGIATSHPEATAAGEAVLAAGGNAFDAAVAISAALAVVEPYGSGMGGGGFWLMHDAGSGREFMVDGRERAPLAAHRDMFLDEDGEAVRELSMEGPLAAGIPGQPAALVHIAEHYGELPLAESLAPAIRLAREGFAVDEGYQWAASFRKELLNEWPEAASAFLVDGQAPESGHILRQPELADTLQRIADQGHAGFYDGPVAERLVAGVRDAGGIWQMSDLSEYEVVERDPIVGEYRGMRVVSASPPSSGGVVLVQMLNILSVWELERLEPAERKHVVAESMRRAYHDRARYLGDPDFVDIPIERLIDPVYADGLRATLRSDRATPSEVFVGAAVDEPGGRDTTHFSVIDDDGNRVAATLSINWPFGSGVMPAGTGILLNNEMDDFSARPGTPNVYGLVHGEANAIAPGKRMLSSMSPTFLEHNGRVAVLGTPGGSRIITMVLLAGLDFHEGGDAESMVSLPRYHHQYLPDAIQHEPDFPPPAIREALEARGHEFDEVGWRYGDMQVVIHTVEGDMEAAADPRGGGAAVVVSR